MNYEYALVSTSLERATLSHGSRHTAPRKAYRLAVGWVAGEGAYFCLSDPFEKVN